MATLYPCPCCGKMTPGRSTPIPPADCARSYLVMLGKGVSRESMLGEHRATFDAIAPGLTAWVEQNITPELDTALTEPVVRRFVPPA
jgi:hypothetical protein